MDRKTKSKYIGAFGALIVHIAIIALLFLVSFAFPEHTEESGVPVMLGDAVAAQGGFDPSTLVDVDILPEEKPVAAQPQEASEQEIITQTEEETVALSPKKEAEKKKEIKRPEKTAAEKAADARRLADEKAEREQKAAAEIANKRVAGAFGKGVEMGNRGTSATGKGTEGSKSGNSPTGALTGNGGYGTFDLGGRSIGAGGLPRPLYNVQDEGKVVVTITVNPSGTVIDTSINRLTNTVNSALRKAAEDAAKKAHFNRIDGVNNQTGTITYYFNLR
ncbi:cell envelope integrity protein TolA [uncultured Bacteroides sp.]|uniref:cell envelope integrity protein TolA n=1 Tax=uncultured Bacteroides sp. TaxID=162156 RepID=UPI002AA83E7D|nr:cell envelope integrity protein TolA [uncultured Bacteroides sp.]